MAEKTNERFAPENVAELLSGCISYALGRSGISSFRQVFYGGGHAFQVQVASGEWFLISVERGPK